MSNTAIEQTYFNELEEKSSPGKKNMYLLSALLFCTCLFIGCASFFYKGGYLGVMQLGLLLVLGCLYTVYVPASTMTSEGKNNLKNILFLSLALMICLGVVSFFTDALGWYDCLAFSSAFLLPGIILYSWRMFRAIPPGSGRVWYYSHDIPPEPGFVYLENKPVRMRVSANGTGPTEIRSIIPASLKLGVAFYYVLKSQEKNSDPEQLFLDENQNPYGWSFYTTRFGFHKVYLDPDETVLENRIKANATINAVRINRINN